MKKRIGTLIVTMCFVVLGIMGMTAQADAATIQHGLADYMYTTDGAESINISLHKYNRFQSKEDQSYLLKNENGGYTRLEFIKQGVDIYDEYGLFIEEYDKSFNLKSTKEVTMPYPIFGGVCFGEEYNFLFSSQINTSEKDDFPVMYIQIFDKEWTEEIECLEITNDKLGAVEPMDRIYTAFGVASNLQMAEIGDNYYFHFGYEMCQLPEEWGQKIFHQRNATYVLKNTDDGWTFEMFPQLLVSHSWNQFITTDGEYLYLLDQQDGDPKREEQKAAIFYQKIAKDSTNKTGIKSFKTDLKQTYEAYQFTGTSLGSFKLIDNMFFTAGNSEEYYDRPADLRDSHFNQRNIFVDLIDKNFTKDTYSRNWITEYPVVYEDDENYIDVGNPYIVTTDTEYQYVIWSEYIKKTDTSRLGIAKINKKGNRVGDIHYIYGHLSDADPLYVDGELIWYVTGYHEGDLDYPTKPVFYRVNIADLEAGKYDYTESHKLENLTAKLESNEVPYNSRSSSNHAKIAAVTLDGKDYQLVEGVDYTVSYENNLELSKDVGPAKAVITGKGMFSGVKNVEYQVVANDIGKQGYKLILNPAKVEYDPNILYHQRPKYTVVDAEGEVFDNSGSITLENVGENKNMKNIGVVTFAYTPKTYGYTGTITADFTIAARDSDLQNISISFKDLNRKEYTGSPYEPKFYVRVNSSEVNHTVTYKNNIEVGIATAIITVPGYGTFEKTFEITPKIKATGWSGEYDGKPHTIEITGVPEGAIVTYSIDGGKTYTSEKPYFTDINTVTNSSGARVDYKVSIPNYKDFTGYRTIAIRGKSISSMGSKVNGLAASYNYTGKAIVPNVTLTGLVKDKDYTVEITNNINVGTAKVTITGIGLYQGTISKTFEIVKPVLSSQTISVAGSTKTTKITKTYGNAAFNLNAKAKTELTYKTSSSNVATVSSLGRVSIKGTGRATITITAASSDKYKAATKKITIDVKPKKVSSLKLKAAKKKMTVSWKKDSKASGYRIAYTTDKKFKKSIKYTTTTSTKKTISKLKSKKYYYVKVQAYKKVGSTKLYGSYTSVKKVKIK